MFNCVNWGFCSLIGLNLLNDGIVIDDMFLMCFRPLSDDEIKVHTPVVISCIENRREVCAVQSISNKQIDRTFMFDKVFGILSELR